MNPEAVLNFSDGKRIVIELLPDVAFNTVCSFIYAAQQGVFDHHEIERIVPDNWVDFSYTGFGKRAGQYLIPWEHDLFPQKELPIPEYGDVCMGGYGEMGEAGCEFFFPLRRCEEFVNSYPVFGKIQYGLDAVRALSSAETVPVMDFPIPGVVVNKPVHIPELVKVELELHGTVYPEPVKKPMEEMPAPWKQFWENLSGMVQ
jgi:peptidyl-prolyl cis-trans isomerase B (cyclophilin B)